MRILLTNDDGIHAEGLAVLEDIARHLGGEVWVVAPETDQSGLAHSLTLSMPLRVREISQRRYAVNGTPTDCVIMAVRELMDAPPDLVLSGVNRGQNIADDVTYSGTVAGAMEGALLGIPSIALSQAYHFESEERVVPWETARRHAPEMLKKLVARTLPNNVFLNVNFPACEPDEVTGARICRQAERVHGLKLEKRSDGRNLPYYWLKFARETSDPAADTDLAAMADRAIAISPLKIDMTEEALFADLEKAIAS